MPYSVQADVQSAAGGLKKLKELADWDNDGAVDAAEVTSAIASADALIDSYASKRFTVPFNPVPATIKDCSARLARLKLARRRPGLWDQAMQDEWDELAGTDEKKPGWLLLLATGVVTPGGDPLPTKHTTMSVDSVETTLPSDRDVSRDKTGGFW